MNPKFEPIEDGLEIIDPIERHRYRLTTHEPVTPTAVDCDRIQYPIDAAVGITTEMLTLSTKETIYIRSADGSMVGEVQPNEQRSFRQGEYTLDLSASMKVYVNITCGLHIYSDTNRTYISFEDRTHAIIGARSYHTRPAETITTTREPTDVMKAVSAFGSALKTTTPERSYPTLRGHPPKLEQGEELHIPATIDRPQTGIRIEVPPELGYVFVVTPLAYYLGATVTPGPEPKLITETGYTHSLKTDGKFESTVERTLKQLFLLDCIVRTEGMTPLSLHEREAVEPILDFDPGIAYEKSLSEQVAMYLDEPVSSLEPHLPKWQLETRVDSPSETIEFLPFIADDLSIVKLDGRDETRDKKPRVEAQNQAIEAFTRGSGSQTRHSTRGTDTLAHPHGGSETSTVQQRWNGTNSSPISSTTPLTAFQNDIGRTPKDDPISIDVVCNDSKMNEELETVNKFYGNHKELPFDVTIHHNLTKNAFERILTQESDFCHYIGHIDTDGFQCSNGKFDAKSLDSVGLKAFLLNACQSHDQGLTLIEKGSIGGIVTLTDVVNSGAISVGKTIARLLNQGFPIYASLDIARRKNVMAEQYHIVGSGATRIAQSRRGEPAICLVSRENNMWKVEMDTYLTPSSGKGGVFVPHIESINTHYINPGNTKNLSIATSQVLDLLSVDDVPVVYNGEMIWSDMFIKTVESIRDRDKNY
ncbi:hypothetical protein ACFO5R_04180 [Halosolutus amylolyticus]|uniref:CHAT domain-containing protein n=1 Tax=Halosolutus amylolyticus TaxID=2932267 RepID=A0ABD5PMI7_9EURY|nr:hypothetical protein [Halosolutus amylolyticus]